MADKSQQKRFRAIGHKLNPVVTIGGNGFSDSVVAELNR
ncbi:MAG: RNA-binding protein, partial [Candidatus Azotimanducaceae bacterium]